MRCETDQVTVQRTQRKIARALGILIVSTVSTAISVAVADVVMDALQEHERPSFYTNLTPAELAKLPVRTSGTITGAYLDDIVDLPWHEPGQFWVWAGQRDRAVEFLVKGRWNNIGCHDNVDYPMSTRPAVLFLGDSFVETMQLDIRDTFHDRLRHTSFGTRFDVWACGVAGWNPTRVSRYMNDDPRIVEIPALRQLAKLKPAYVMYFVFIGNDLRDQAGPSFEDALASAPHCASPVAPSASLLWFKVRQVADMYFTRGGSEYRCIDNQFWPYVPAHIPAVEDGWKAMFEGLDRLHGTITERGARLIVSMIEPFPIPYGMWTTQSVIRANYPGGKALSLDPSLPRNRLRAYAASRGLTFVDISEVLRGCGGHDHYYPHDEHFTANGHRCLAEYLDSHQEMLFP